MSSEKFVDWPISSAHLIIIFTKACCIVLVFNVKTDFADPVLVIVLVVVIILKS